MAAAALMVGDANGQSSFAQIPYDQNWHNPNVSLADAVMAQPTKRIVHAWGQGVGRWKSEAIPYFQEMDTDPLVVSTYVRLGEVKSEARRQLQIIHGGYENRGTDLRFIPMLGVMLTVGSMEKRNAARTVAMREALGLPQNVHDPENALRRALRDQRSWNQLSGRLRTQGYNLEGLQNLPQLSKKDPAAARTAIKKFQSQLNVRISRNMREEGFPFADLKVINGDFDQDIRALGQAVAGIPGPVLLRFMFESIYGIHATMIHGPDTFSEAWIHFVTLIREEGATNAEFIFHPNSGDHEALARWYPGDEYVDWVGCSLFDPKNIEDCAGAADFASLHDKPFGVVESAPTSPAFRQKGIETPGVWRDWFEPYFVFIRRHENVRLFTYINIDWGRGQSDFSHWGNTRIQSSRSVAIAYQEEMGRPEYIHNNEQY